MLPPPFRGQKAELAQARRLGFDEGIPDEIGKDLASPQPERLGQARLGSARIAGAKQSVALFDQAFEDYGVHVIGLGSNDVARRLGDEHTR